MNLLDILKLLPSTFIRQVRGQDKRICSLILAVIKGLKKFDDSKFINYSLKRIVLHLVLFSNLQQMSGCLNLGVGGQMCCVYVFQNSADKNNSFIHCMVLENIHSPSPLMKGH